MIRTGDEYRASIRDGREVYINGERVDDVVTHPAFKPLVDVRARIYDMAHDPSTRSLMTYANHLGELHAVFLKLPYLEQDWWDKARAVDAVFDDVGGVVTRVGDETIGEMWSLFDGMRVLDEVDPRFSANVRYHVNRVTRLDLFHVSANTDPKGDRSKAPQEQDPDMLLHLVRETDAGIVGTRREVRDRGCLCESSLREADDCELGERGAVRLRPGVHLRPRVPRSEVHLPHGLRAETAG